MKFKKLSIMARDEKIEHNIEVAHIFVDDYKKKVKKNEFHCPLAARLIVKEQNNIYHYILLNSIIKSNNDGDIEVFAPYNIEFLSHKKEYFTPKELGHYNSLFSLYRQKEKIGLTNNEMLEYSIAKTAIKLMKVLKLKIPYDIGGGF